MNSTLQTATRDLPVEHMIRLGVASMIMFATIMLGIGEGSAALSLCTLVAIAVSAYVTDIRQAFALNQNLANFVALGIVAVSAANMLVIDRSGLIGAVASLQSYLQYVLLFQTKSPRVYWQLALLSLGQVAIAATLVAGPLFGVLLLVYLLLGVVTFTLMLLQTEAGRYAAPAAVGSTEALLASGGAVRLQGSVATVPPRFSAGLLEQLLGVGCVTFVVASVLFFFIPRTDSDARSSADVDTLRTVGFTSTITLGELGEVVQNPDNVMRIQFYHKGNNKPFKLATEPLFGGSVVSSYKAGVWKQDRSGIELPLPTGEPRNYVRQHITVEPLDVPELFSVVPVFALHADGPNLKVDNALGQLLRDEDDQDRHAEFELGTTGIINNRCREILPSEALSEVSRRRLMSTPATPPGGTDPLAGLKRLAAEVLEDKGISPSDPLAAARALHDYLRYSGEFLYSLEGQQRDPSLDPLEDFVTVNRSGHCEYFAGALVMMLRSQGIPARMAVGFKGGEWNDVGGYYQIQQLHAHAWVEAYLTIDQVPEDTFIDLESTPEAGWLVLDPTVSTADAAAGGYGLSWWARLRQSIDYGRVLWSNYVVGLNFKRQHERIYDPIRNSARSAFDAVFSRDAWRERGRAIARSPLGTFWQWYRRYWFSWRGGLVAAGATAVLVAGYIALLKLFAAAARWRLARHARKGDEPPPLEMYRRLESALARQGFRRLPSQTAYEFAVAAGGHLAESIELNRVSHLPRRIVETFYRVRFGHRSLDNQEQESVEHALSELERALGRRR